MLFKEINNKYSVEKIRTGYPDTAVLGDELDSASLFLTNIDAINIEPYDVIEFTDLNNKKWYYLVADYVKEYATFQTPYKYNYQVNLMSLTKKLETIILPNLAITNIGQNRTVAFYIRNVLYYFKDTVGFEIPSILETMICPEITLGSSTLREYLDFLYSLAGCIVRLKYNGSRYIISYQDLNERKGEMPREYIATMTSSASAVDYASSLESEIDEFISQESITEVQPLKSDDYVFDSDNAKLILTHKIYDLIKVVAKNIPFELTAELKGYTKDYGVGDIGYNFGSVVISSHLNQEKLYIDVDISDYITTQDIFETLEILKSGEYDYEDSSMNGKNYKNNTLYWNRGNNSIENFNFFQTGNLDWILGTDETAIEVIIKSVIKRKVSEIASSYNYYGMYENLGPFYWTFSADENSILEFYNEYLKWRYLTLETTYIPYSAIRMSIEKNKSTHQVEMVNNQTESLINIDLFSRQSYEKILQLGNDALEFSARNAGNEIKYEIGMTFDDYVLGKLETTHFLDQTYYKGILYKNFSNRNIQVILNRQKRYTALADENEMITRHEIIKKNLYLDFSDIENKELIDTYINNIARYCEFRISEPSVAGHIIPTFTRAGNSIIYTAEFYNNASYGIKRKPFDLSNIFTGFQIMDYLKYVDENGEASGIGLYFYDKPLKNDSDFANDFPLDTENTIGDNFLFNDYYPILKDNREHLKLSYEIIFKSNDLIIGNAFSSVINQGFTQLDVAMVEGEINELTKTDNLTSIRKYVLGNIFNFGLGKNYAVYNEKGLVFGINNLSQNNKYIVLKEE